MASGLTFKGRWNAFNNTYTLIGQNSPAGSLQDGVGTTGDCYIVYIQAANGMSYNLYNRDLGSGSISWIALSYVYYDGTIWKPVGESSGGSGTSPGGSTTEVQYNNSGSFGGASEVTIDTDGRLLLPPSTTLPTISTGGKPYGDTTSGLAQLRWLPQLGIDAPLQRKLGYGTIGVATPTAVTALFVEGHFGASALVTSGGTTTTKTYSSTSVLSCKTRFVMTTSTAANQTAIVRMGNTPPSGLIINDSAYGGGTLLTMTVGFPSYNAGQRVFMGYQTLTSNIAGNIDISTLVNMFGIGKDAADTTLQWMHNNGAGTATEVDTGVTVNTNNVYIIELFIPSNSTALYGTLYEMDKNTCVVVSTVTATTNIPAVGTRLFLQQLVGNAATGVAISMAIITTVEENY